MMNRFDRCVLAIGAIAIATPAVAGEVNGSTTNPKVGFAQGRSMCYFSGLNDYPDGSQSGPAGQTQNYGQWVTLGLSSPSDPSTVGGRGDFWFPANGCNPVWVDENGGGGE